MWVRFDAVGFVMMAVGSGSECEAGAFGIRRRFYAASHGRPGLRGESWTPEAESGVDV